MPSADFSELVKSSPVASRARVPLQVVFRSFHRSPGGLSAEFAGGTVSVDSQPLCVLVAGGKPVANGRIEERDGRVFFVAAEVAE